MRGSDMPGAFDVAIDALPGAIAIVDAESAIVFANRELARQFGYSREQLVGQHVEVILPDPAFSTALERERAAASRQPPGDLAPSEFMARRQDGSQFAAEVLLSPLATDNGRLVLAAIADLAARHRGSRDAATDLPDTRFAFESFVAELSGEFINRPADQIAEAIESGLRRTSDMLRCDGSALYTLANDGVPAMRAQWTSPGAPAMDLSGPGPSGLPWSFERLLAGAVVSFATLGEIPCDTDRRGYEAIGIGSAVVVPLAVAGQLAGVFACSTVKPGWAIDADVRHRAAVIATIFGQVLARQQREAALQAAAAEAQRLKDRLQVENVYLRREVRERSGLSGIVGQSAGVRRVLDRIQQVAETDSTVLLLGETGTGKELFATQVHELGRRRGRAMVRVNCAAIPATLIESELFGREKGAFTGALARQIGRFELAHHSTIFLDEIGDLPPDVQVKLLRVLEERQIERLGSPRPITVDVRIIAATHRNLEKLMSEGAFREDLYYRLSVFPVHVPPLRERAEDIPLLVWRFVEEFSKTFGKRIDVIDKDDLATLQHYPWPGNIRELRNVVERAMIAANGRRLTIAVPLAAPAPSRRSPRLADVEKEHIRAVVESTGWRIRGAGGAADRLGLKPTTLETRMAKLGLKRPGQP